MQDYISFCSQSHNSYGITQPGFKSPLSFILFWRMLKSGMLNIFAKVKITGQSFCVCLHKVKYLNNAHFLLRVSTFKEVLLIHPILPFLSSVKLPINNIFTQVVSCVIWVSQSIFKKDDIGTWQLLSDFVLFMLFCLSKHFEHRFLERLSIES